MWGDGSQGDLQWSTIYSLESMLDMTVLAEDTVLAPCRHEYQSTEPGDTPHHYDV